MIVCRKTLTVRLSSITTRSVTALALLYHALLLSPQAQGCRCSIEYFVFAEILFAGGEMAAGVCHYLLNAMGKSLGYFHFCHQFPKDTNV